MSRQNDSSLVGSKVLVQTDDGDYEGVIKSVLGDLSKVSLFNVKVLPEGKPLIGLQTFFGHEIKHFQILEAKHKILKEKTTKNRNIILAPLPFGQVDTAEGEEMAEANKPKYRKLVLKKGKLWLVMGAGKDSSDSFDLELDKPLANFELPERYEIIDAINDDFKNAIAIIRQQSFIGIHVEGANMGRQGEVCLLSISTRNCIYLFDIFEIGNDAFAAGLKEILEDENVTKVFHDCRLPSDILFHHHKVTLKNVSDTQVIDIMQRRYYGQKQQLPESVRTLASLCKEFLKLDEESIGFYQEHQNRSLNDVMSWQVRPLPQNHRICAISNVLYLIELRKNLMEKFLRDITKGTEIYLGLVRDSNDDHFAMEMANSIALPPAIDHMFGQQLRLNNNFLKPRNTRGGLCVFDKIDTLKTVMTGDEAVDFCMKEFKISDFKEEDSDPMAEEARNVKLLKELKVKSKVSDRFKFLRGESLKPKPTENYGMVRPSEESSDKSTGSVSSSSPAKTITPQVKSNLKTSNLSSKKKPNFIPAGSESSNRN